MRTQGKQKRREHSTSHLPGVQLETACTCFDTKLTKKGDQYVDQLSNLDHVPTNTHSSEGVSQLHIPEDNEASSKAEVQQ